MTHNPNLTGDDREILTSTSNELSWLNMSEYFTDDDNLREFYEDIHGDDHNLEAGEFPGPYYSVTLYKVLKGNTSWEALFPGPKYCYRLDIVVINEVDGWETHRPLTIELFSLHKLNSWADVRNILRQYLEPFRALIRQYSGDFLVPERNDVEAPAVYEFIKAILGKRIELLTLDDIMSQYERWKAVYYETSKFCDYITAGRDCSFWEYGQEILFSEWLDQLKA
jgi:hypothetical protein